jgi:hypothetical protein
MAHFRAHWSLPAVKPLGQYRSRLFKKLDCRNYWGERGSIYMILYYRLPGIVATLALLVYALFFLCDLYVI